MDEDMPLGEFGSGIYHTIRTLAEELLDDVLKKDIGDPNTFERDCKSSILFFFCKAYKSYQAIYHLWYSGFDQDAGIINRTLFELLLQATWINHDSKTNAPLFQDHVQT